MSQLQNRHWIGFNGEPIAGRMPPQLLVYGPELTGQQRGEVFHIYKLFTDACHVALGDYHVRNRVLSDGSRVRCTSFMGQDTVQVWTERKEGEEEWAGGFMWQLGSNPGLDTTNVLFNAKYDKRRGFALPEYKLIYNCPPRWGDVDWQGEDPKVDVLSWDAQSIERWDLSYIPPAGVNAFSNVPTKPRYFSRGSGMSVYSRFGTLHTTYAGFAIEGAAYVRLDRKYLVFVRRITGIAFEVVLVVDGSERIIGTFARPNTTFQVMHSWFFSKSGRKARTVIFNASSMYVVELTISGTNSDNAAATFSPTTIQTQTYPVQDLRETRSWYRFGELAPGGGYQGVTINTLTLDPFTIIPESPVFCTDFRGETPVDLRLRRTDFFPYNHTTELYGTDSTATGGHASGTRVGGKTGLIDRFVIQLGGEDSEIFEAFKIDCPAYTANVSTHADPVYTTPLTYTYVENKLLDIDLRTGARVFQRLTHTAENIEVATVTSANYDATVLIEAVFNAGAGDDVTLDSATSSFRVVSYSHRLVSQPPPRETFVLDAEGEYSGSWRINVFAGPNLDYRQFLKMFGRHFVLGHDNEIHTGRLYWPIHTPLGYEATQPPVGAIRTYYGLALGAGHIFSYTPISAAPTITETVATSAARGYRLSISNDPLAMLVADIFDKFELTHSGTTWPAKLGVY